MVCIVYGVFCLVSVVVVSFVIVSVVKFGGVGSGGFDSRFCD